MITVEKLESNGYRKFVDTSKLSGTIEQDPYKVTWQKCVRDDKGKKYFINIELWDFKNSQYADRVNIEDKSFPSWSQMEFQNEQNFRVSLFYNKEQSLDDVEAWYEKQWKINEAAYYELNEDA